MDKDTGKNSRVENMLVQTPEGILVNGMLDWDSERRGGNRGRQDGVESLVRIKGEPSARGAGRKR